MRFSLAVLPTISLVAFATCPVLARKIELPKVQVDCKTYAQKREPINLLSTESLLPPELRSEQEFQIKQPIWQLLAQKRWDEAQAEIEKISYPRLRNQMRFELVQSLSNSAQTNRALPLVVKFFPAKQSYDRARAIGAVAVGMVKSGQFSQVVEALRYLPNDAKNADSAIVPVIEAILTQDDSEPRMNSEPQAGRTSVTSEQLAQIQEVVSVFPNPAVQDEIWHSIGETVKLEPAIALQVAGLIRNQTLRSEMLERVAKRWFSSYGYSLGDDVAVQKGGEIANQIESCVVRSSAFLGLAAQVISSREFNRSEQFQLLDQVEALINVIDQDQLGDRPVAAKLRLKLVELNAQADRNSQSLKLLKRVTDDQKKFRFNVDRAAMLSTIAQHYYDLKEPTAAIQALDLAVIAIQTASAKKENASAPITRDGKLERNLLLTNIRYLYERLNQPAKAATIKRMLSSPN